MTTTIDPRRTLEAARKAHRAGELDTARRCYRQVIEADAGGRLGERAEIGLALLDAGRTPPATGGRQALGLTVAGIVIGYLALIALPREFSYVTLVVFVVCVGLGFVGGLIALFRGGLANRACGALAVVIVAALFLPAMLADRTRQLRFEAMEGVAVAQGARLAVAEQWTATGSLPDSNRAAGLAAPGSFAAGYVERVDVSTGGVVTVRFRGGHTDGQSLEYRPRVDSAGVTWDCRGGTLVRAARPPECR